MNQHVRNVRFSVGSVVCEILILDQSLSQSGCVILKHTRFNIISWKAMTPCKVLHWQPCGFFGSHYWPSGLADLGGAQGPS